MVVVPGRTQNLKRGARALVLGTGCLLVHAASCWFGIGYHGHKAEAALVLGSVSLRWSPKFAAGQPGDYLGWFAHRAEVGATRLRPDWIIDDEQSSVRIPFWLVDLAVAVGLMWWWRAGRHRSGFCSCGYPVMGGCSGLCPECGRSLTETESHPPDHGQS